MIVDHFSHQATNTPRTISRGNSVAESPTRTTDRNRKLIARTIVLCNTTLAVAYLQVFFQIDSRVTVGVTVPDLVIPVAPNANLTIPVDDLGFLMGDASNGVSVAGTTTRSGSTSAPIDLLILFN